MQTAESPRAITADVAPAFTHTIGGRAAGSESSFDVINPATAQPFARCPDASRQDLDAAVSAARAALAAWSACDVAERGERLRAFATAIRVRSDELANLLVREQGKPLFSARGEIARTCEWIESLSALRLPVEVLRTTATQRVELRYHPVGVVGAITPWNVPILLGSLKIAQALVTGNTIVVKPSPYTPLTTLMLGEIGRDCFPAGVFNVVAGGNDLGAWMTEHPGIDKISFTGSVATGKRVVASAATTLKRVTLELGGNDAAIVLEDADVDLMGPELFAMAFINCGQICMAIKRLYVHERIYDRIVDLFADMARSWRVGDGFEPDVQMGPIQNRMQFDKVLAILDDTKQQRDARIVAGGAPLDRAGYFLAPTVVAGLAEGTRLVDEEPFGPIVPLIRFSDERDAVTRANATRFGLGGSVWSRDVEHAAELATHLEAGSVWVNGHAHVDAGAPFGGMKSSGMGREGGLLGLQAYVEPQVLRRPV